MNWSRAISHTMLLLAILLAMAACRPAAPLPSPSVLPEPTRAVVLTIAAGPTGQEQLARWIAHYQEARPGTQVQVWSADTDQAQSMLARGEVDLALLDEQPAGFYRGVLTATRVAWEPLAIVVHPQSRLRDIATPALVELFRGRVADWSLLGGQVGPVQIYTLPATSGTVQSFVGEAMTGDPLSPQALVVATPEALLLAVGADPGGIGIVPGGTTTGTAVLSVDGRQLIDPSYPWRSPLFLVHGARPSAGALEFILVAAQAAYRQE